MIENIIKDFEKLIRLVPDLLTAVTANSTSTEELHDTVVQALRTDPDARHSFHRACCFETPFGESWVHEAGKDSPYLSLDLAAEALDATQYRALLADVLMSTSTTIPYDYRALAAERLVEIGLGETEDALRRVLAPTDGIPERTLEMKLDVRTDGIDHLFDIPLDIEGRLDLLKEASAIKCRESRKLLALRVLERSGKSGQAEESGRVSNYASDTAEQLIRQDVGTSMVSATDYLVPWDQILASAGGADDGLTLAELLRIVLLAPEFKLPDTTVRPVLVAFYRSVLRISGRSIVGLGSGVFYVEHGADANPSYFYMGRDVVLGKGCTIDCVGGAVLQQGAFLGGGFMPVLIHTHKHIRKPGEPGAAERKQVLPALFVAEAGARLPMDAIGIFETANYLGLGESPYDGIYAVALTK
ncbi:hypothetical protein [Streptomyces sp. V1I1]|uniref:hypothetical protein n=1 Tax=Streptomyces sp. V1I1 TaxID=3042272 RepID=UPI002789D923|nr:hypothetical protein [Streptomyces sp. V1I1]MDQ0946031.1 hypothetical protein [Streptomyces sp. V1I1]